MKKLITLLIATVVLGCEGQSKPHETVDKEETTPPELSLRIQRSNEDTVPIDCEAEGINEVWFLVYDDNNKLLDDEQFPCQDREGNLLNMKAGEALDFVALGLDSDKRVVYRGKTTKMLAAGTEEFVPINLTEVQSLSILKKKDASGSKLEITYHMPKDSDEIDTTEIKCMSPQEWEPGQYDSCMEAEDDANKIITCTFTNLTENTDYCFAASNTYSEITAPILFAQECLTMISIVPPDKDRDYTTLDYDRDTGEIFEDTEDYTMVHDNSTGLTWQAKSRNGDIHDSAVTRTYHAAMDYTDYLNLENIKFGGDHQYPWRLPTRREMVTLFKYNDEDWAGIDLDFFPNLKGHDEQNNPYYWLTDTRSDKTQMGYGPNFFAGRVAAGESGPIGIYSDNNQTLRGFTVCAVRGPLRSNDFYSNEDIVIDKASGLMWQRVPEVRESGWSYSDAKRYCEDLKLEGHRNWRLPTIMELNTIFDHLYTSGSEESHFHESIKEKNLYVTSTAPKKMNRVYVMDIRHGFSLGRVPTEEWSEDNQDGWNAENVGVIAVRHLAETDLTEMDQ